MCRRGSSSLQCGRRHVTGVLSEKVIVVNARRTWETTDNRQSKSFSPNILRSTGGRATPPRHISGTADAILDKTYQPSSLLIVLGASAPPPTPVVFSVVLLFASCSILRRFRFAKDSRKPSSFESTNDQIVSIRVMAFLS